VSPTLTGECSAGFTPTTLPSSTGLSTCLIAATNPTLLSWLSAWSCVSPVTTGTPPCTEPGPAQYERSTVVSGATDWPAFGEVDRTSPAVHVVLCTCVCVPALSCCCCNSACASVRLRPIRLGTFVSWLRFVRYRPVPSAASATSPSTVNVTMTQV